MRTRAQVNAWKEVTAQHRRDTATFAASIAASRRAHEVAASTAPSAASNRPANPTAQDQQTFVTPEKKTRKRKLSSSPVASPSAQGGSAISPAVRDAKRRSLAAPSNAKSTLIRRTLNYSGPRPSPSPSTSTTATEQRTVVPAASLAPETILERVASGTTVSAVVGRAEERQQIENAFRADASTRALFVIGPPGTGKSSCVAHVAAQHVHSHVARVNCSTFASPAALFAGVGEQLHSLTKLDLPELDDPQGLDEFLQSVLHTSPTKAARNQCLVVLDEVDHLVRLPSVLQLKAQSVLHFFVRWAHLPNSTLRFVGILNGVDMHAQIAEFLAHDPNPTNVVLFPSYSHDELREILDNYVQSALPVGVDKQRVGEVVEPRALELIARKIAARDGDARRAVGLLQQCARSCLSQFGASSPPATSLSPPKKLTIRDVLNCTSSAIAAQPTVAKQIQQLPRQPKLLLYAVTRLAACETATASLEDVCDELAMLQATQSHLAWIPRFSLEQLQQHLGSLECYALVKQTAAKSKSAWKARLTSSVTMETLMKAFQHDELLKELPMK